MIVGVFFLYHLPYNIKFPETTPVVIWHYINKTELNCKMQTQLVQHVCKIEGHHVTNPPQVTMKKENKSFQFFLATSTSLHQFASILYFAVSVSSCSHKPLQFKKFSPSMLFYHVLVLLAKFCFSFFNWKLFFEAFFKNCVCQTTLSSLQFLSFFGNMN